MPPAMAVPSAARISGTFGRHVRSSAFHGQVGIGGQAGLHVDLVGRGVALVPARHLLEVGARAEVPAGTGEDERPDVGVLVGLDTGVVEADEHLAVDGVLPLGTVERDDQQVTLTFGEHCRHRRIPLGWRLLDRRTLGQNKNRFYFLVRRSAGPDRVPLHRPRGGNSFSGSSSRPGG